MTSRWKHAALVLAGHGSARNPDSRLPTEQLAAALAARGLFAEVAACYLKEPPFAADALAGVAAAEVYVVPNLSGEGHISRVALPRALGLDGPLTLRDGRRIHYAEPVGSHPLVPELLRRRAEALIAAHRLDRRDVALLLIGHGASRPRATATPEAIAAALRAPGDLAEVAVAYIEQEPFLADWPKLVSAPVVIAAPLLIAEGMHGSEDVPPAFGLAAGESGPVQAHGRTVHLCRGLGGAPELAEIVLDRVAECDRRDG